MAFPIPAHLPRKQDISTKILSRLDEATDDTFDASMAKSWRAELDEAIFATKKQIHDRIQSDLPAWERQFSAAKSVQARMTSLSDEVSKLDSTLSSPETGLIPSLLHTLQTHHALAQAASDAFMLRDNLAHLARCNAELKALDTLVDDGALPEAANACDRFRELLDDSPSPLDRAEVLLDMTRRLRATTDRVQELLSDAYVMSVVISPSEIVIRPSVLVLQSKIPLGLSTIFSSLSSSSAASHLSTLRRDLTTYYIEHLCTQPVSIEIISSPSPLPIPSSPVSAPTSLTHTLTLFPSPPATSTPTTRLSTFATLLDFLHTHLFPHIPPPHHTSFIHMLCKPFTSALLSRLLIPALPSTLALLPPFLELAARAVAFEDKYIAGMLGSSSGDREIKDWVAGVSGHYERRRRVEILQRSRDLIEMHGSEEIVRVEMRVVQVEKGQDGAQDLEQADNFADANDTWNLDDENGETVSGKQSAEDVNGWGFDEEEVDADMGNPESELAEPAEMHAPVGDDEEGELPDAWGFNDDDDMDVSADGNTEESAWDDPWSDESPQPPKPIAASIPALSPKSPRPATRLEKHSLKSHQTNGSSPQTPNPQTPNTLAPPAPLASAQQPPVATNKHVKAASQSASVETYAVSKRAKNILEIFENTLREGREVVSSGIFGQSPNTSSVPGALILQTATLVLDLYRALYPIIHSSQLMASRNAVLFCNDCLYLSEQITNTVMQERELLIVKDKLAECQRSLKILSDSWYYDTIEKQRQSINDILASAEGFTDTTDQDRYDECEAAITLVLREIRNVSYQWKAVLAKSKFYAAVGMLVDGALSKILDDILALPDIPEVESHKLSELCRILNALEGLFVEDHSESSFVVSYVSSWLKFSYLSELLEASMADITYLFEEGALVDFEIDELVKLVRALFADTALRTNTINKIMAGHPVTH